VVTLQPFALERRGHRVGLVVLVALLVCLIPTTIGALLSAIGIAGMDRLVQRNVLAMSGRAVEAAGDVHAAAGQDRHHHPRQPAGLRVHPGRRRREIEELADAAQLSSLADETPEGRSIVVLAKEKYGHARARGARPRTSSSSRSPRRPACRASTCDGRQIRKGAAEFGARLGARQRRLGRPKDGEAASTRIAGPAARPAGGRSGATRQVLGVIHLKDVVKDGIKERFAELRKMGIRTVMITGDNPLTAKAIAEEAGVDDFLAEATPEDKMALIKAEQEGGKLVAMTGDGTNDAPALAQADVGVAMNTGTSAAKEAGNMVDLDSNPTKLIEIVEIGKQLLITRGALTTFSIANDVAKYFAIIPAMFAGVYPGLEKLNIMHLHSPQSAILSAVDLQRAHHRGADPAGPARRALHARSSAAAVRGHAAPQPLDLRRRRASSPTFSEDSTLGEYTIQLANGCDYAASGSNNLGPNSPNLVTLVTVMRQDMAAFDSVPGYTVTAAQVASDAVTESGSDEEPYITPQNADQQAARIAATRGISVAQVEAAIKANTAGRDIGILGEPAVNVTTLNIALDKQYPSGDSSVTSFNEATASS
jgi:soluble P-type ATPase